MMDSRIIPPSLRHEHGEMQAELEELARSPSAVGDAARAVARLMRPHFRKEEEFALPPLGALATLAGGGVPEEAEAIIGMAGRLKADLETMLAEHKAIAAALQEMYDAATAVERPDHARFARKLLLHARTEEEILYPAAILVGAYLGSLSRER